VSSSLVICPAVLVSVSLPLSLFLILNFHFFKYLFFFFFFFFFQVSHWEEECRRYIPVDCITVVKLSTLIDQAKKKLTSKKGVKDPQSRSNMISDRDALLEKISYLNAVGN
jgi:hypothetical protein